MNLTPEQKAIGKENFFAAIGSNVPGPDGEPPRREFLEQRIRDGLELGALPGHTYFGYADYEETFRERGPVRVGIIGTGDEGSVLIGAINPKFLRVKSIADIRPYSQYRAFHGDVYSPAAAQVRPGLLKVYGCEPEIDLEHLKSGDDAIEQVKQSRAEAEARAKEYGLVTADERARMDAGEIEKDPLEVPSETMPAGRRRVIMEGVPGTKLVTTRVTYHNADKVKEEKVSESIIETAVAKRIMVGTGPAPADD